MKYLYFITAAVVSCIVLLSLTGGFSTHSVLSIQTERQGETLWEDTVSTGDMIELSWIHSVEKTPWIERYQITENGDFMLEEIILESFGAGTPSQKGKLVMEDGLIKMQDIHEKHELIRWIHSHQAKHKVKKNGDVIIETNQIPHHESVEMVIKER